MTEKQEQTYEYCKKHKQYIHYLKSKLPDVGLSRQKYGCGSQAPNIEHLLEEIHLEMYESIHESLRTAEEKVNKIIRDI